VQIIPEIDMPGHAQAPLAAYPELGESTAIQRCRVGQLGACISHLFNLEPDTFEFCQNYSMRCWNCSLHATLHIGGDEAVKDEWNASETVSRRERGFWGYRDAEALQTYFAQKISGYLIGEGRRAWAGMNHAAWPGSRPRFVMSWHGASAAHAAAIRGNDAVLAPDPRFVLDHRQSSVGDRTPGRIQIISLKSVL